MKYILICHRHFYHLYAWDSRHHVLQWTETSRHWSPLVDRLEQHKARSVFIVDALPTHTLKTDHAPGSLRGHEFLWWAWHKWRMYTQQSALAAVCFHWVYAFKSLIVATSPASLGLSSLTQGLKDKAIGVHIDSYPLSLALGLWPSVSLKTSDTPDTIIMAVDSNKTILLAFFHKKHLIHVKYPIPVGDPVTEAQAKNTVHDTIRHVEKLTSLRFHTPVIVAEQGDDTPWLSTLWPHYAIHSVKDVWQDQGDDFHVSGSQHGMLDHMVVSHVGKRAWWRSGGGCHRRPAENKGRIIPLWMRLSVWTMLVASMTFLINGIYHLHSVHQDYRQWTETMTALEWTLRVHPVSYSLIETMRTMQQSAAQQTDRLYRYVTLLRHVLHDQYRLKALFIHEDRVRLTLRPIAPYAHIESLMETAQSAGLPLTREDSATSSPEDLHFQSTPSPLHPSLPPHDDQKRSA